MPPNYEPPECCAWSLTFAEGYFLLWHQSLINLIYWLALTQGDMLRTTARFSMGGQWEMTASPSLKMMSSRSPFKCFSMLQHNILYEVKSLGTQGCKYTSELNIKVHFQKHKRVYSNMTAYAIKVSTRSASNMLLNSFDMLFSLNSKCLSFKDILLYICSLHLN